MEVESNQEINLLHKVIIDMLEYLLIVLQQGDCIYGIKKNLFITIHIIIYLLLWFF